jgi:hypothetical protein
MDRAPVEHEPVSRGTGVSKRAADLWCRDQNTRQEDVGGLWHLACESDRGALEAVARQSQRLL